MTPPPMQPGSSSGSAHAPHRRPEGEPGLVFRRLTPSLLDDLGRVLSGTWGRSCWYLHPRLTAALERELHGSHLRRQRLLRNRAPLPPRGLPHHPETPEGRPPQLDATRDDAHRVPGDRTAPMSDVETSSSPDDLAHGWRRLVSIVP